MNLRPALLSVHRWVGLTLGLIVIVSATTGAGMAYRRQLDPVVYPQLFKGSACAQPLPLDRFTQAAKVAHSTSAVDYIRIRGESDAPVNVRFLDKDSLFFDRCTAALTGSQNRYSGVFGVLEYIHRGQWVTNGGWIMGTGALAMLLVLGGVGLFLWWPHKPRRFRQGLTLDPRLKGPAFTLGLHRTVGAWAALFLMTSALTGLPNAFEGVKAALMSLGSGDPKVEVKSILPAQRNAPSLPLNDAWAIVTRLSPDPQEALLHVARKAPTDPMEIFIIDAGAPHPNARTYLYLDAYSGDILKFAPYGQSGVGSQIYYWMLSVHTGKVGGLAGQFALFFGATCASVLGYTGISSYVRRYLRKRKARRAGVAATAAPASPTTAWV